MNAFNLDWLYDPEEKQLPEERIVELNAEQTRRTLLLNAGMLDQEEAIK